MKWVRIIGGAVLLALSGCQAQGEVVHPALWEVIGPNGERAWLFGTIHALPRPVEWRSPAMEAALAQSDRLVMEIGRNDSPAAIDRLYRQLAASRKLAPLIERIAPERQAELVQVMKRHGLDPADFDQTETWAAALALSRAATRDAERSYGMEDELLKAARHKPVIALEGAEAQLRAFDSLPEAEQRDLLGAIITEAGGALDSEQLAKAWSSGDMASLAAQTGTGILADPELREVLLVSRNRAWSARIAILMQSGAKPMVAVGAAHMAGTDGLPAELARRGFVVHRLQ